MQNIMIISYALMFFLSVWCKFAVFFLQILSKITHIHRNFLILNIRIAERKIFYTALHTTVWAWAGGKQWSRTGICSSWSCVSCHHSLMEGARPPPSYSRGWPTWPLGGPFFSKLSQNFCPDPWITKYIYQMEIPGVWSLKNVLYNYIFIHTIITC